jgi:ubiquinone/menaquinone biosynthesis C-methylase UbiE
MGKYKKYIDFLSGYNPAPGFSTCDYIYHPSLDIFFDIENYRFENIKDTSINLIRCRNAVHHVPDLYKLVKEFNRVLTSFGKVVIIECREDKYPANFLLDTIWYRGVNNREEIWFSPVYRNYTDILTTQQFTLIESKQTELKEIKVFIKNFI